MMERIEDVTCYSESGRLLHRVHYRSDDHQLLDRAYALLMNTYTASLDLPEAWARIGEHGVFLLLANGWADVVRGTLIAFEPTIGAPSPYYGNPTREEVR